MKLSDISDIAQQVLGWGFLHADVSEEFLAGIFQRSPEDVDHIVDDEETVMVVCGVWTKRYSRSRKLKKLLVFFLLICTFAALMKRVLIGIVAALVLFGCGQSYEETKRITREQHQKMFREDSAALKVAVLPTLDCLPVFLAEDHELFDTVVDIRLKHFTAQMDIDTALINNRVELGVTDLVRAERMMKQRAPIEYLTATNAYWQIVSNRVARINDLKHLDDKMLAMTRYSVTDMIGELAVDSAKLKPERVFRLQINDVNVRLKMLENNEMDALVMTEPQAAQARWLKNKVIFDSRKQDMQMGAFVMQSSVLKERMRKVQLKVFIKGYNAACDSINKYGVAHYKDLVVKYCKVRREAVDIIPKDLKFSHITKPREKDIERAQKWLSKK